MNTNIFIYDDETDYKLNKILKNLIEIHNINIIIINLNNIDNYIKNLPECFYSLKLNHKIDFIKVTILCDFGGIWLNSNILVLKPLDSLFKFLENNDGFFFIDNENKILDDCIGSNPNTILMLEWKEKINNILNIDNYNISINKLSLDILQTLKIEKYKIINGNNTVYPILKINCTNEFLNKVYNNYKKIIKEFQPIIILDKSIIIEYEKFNTYDKIPLNYFINNSIKYKKNELTYSEYIKNNIKLNIKEINKIINNNNKVNIAIIIPYRDNFIELNKLIKYFKNFKLEKNYNYDLYIIDQNNYDLFNKGLLLNIGYYISNKNNNYDRYLFHDIGYYPSEKMFNLYFENININIYYTYSLYSNKNFIKGVFGLNNYTINKINGFSNIFFGNGIEESIYNRFINCNINIYKPKKNIESEDEYYYEKIIKNEEEEKINNKIEQKILKDLNNYFKDGINKLNEYIIDYKKYENIEYLDKKNNEKKYFLGNYICENINKINIFSISYIAMHTPFIDYYFTSKDLNNKIQEKLTKNPEYYQHSIDKTFIDILEPLSNWDEIESKIIKTYTKPKKFNSIKTENNIDITIKNLVNDEFKIYEYFSKEILFDTLKFIVETYGSIIYIRLRDNKIECSYQISFKKVNIDWIEEITYNNKPIDKSIVNIFEENKRNYLTLKNMHYKKVNNCLLNFDKKRFDENNILSYTTEFIEMINYTIDKYKKIPDCDLLINRKDFPLLRKDNKYSYTQLIDKYIPNPLKNYYPILSQSKTIDNRDIPIPSSDEWTSTLENNNFDIEWSNKKNIAVFRGKSTGCCINEENNLRIKLSQLSYDKIYGDNIDVCLSSFTKNFKVCNKKLQTNMTNYNHLIGNFLTKEEQSLYKYIFNIEGNAQAYRYSSEFNKKSVVLGVESKYYMWFEKLLINKKNFIFIDRDFSNLKKELLFLNKNDNKAKIIMENGLEFHKNYINKNSISTYWFYVMYYLNMMDI